MFPSGFQHIHSIDSVVECVEAELGFVLRFLIQLPSQLMQFVRQEIHLDVMDVQEIPVGNPAVDLWVKRLHVVSIVAHLQSASLAPGWLGRSSLL
jgi:hypothetical protein